MPQNILLTFPAGPESWCGRKIIYKVIIRKKESGFAFEHYKTTGDTSSSVLKVSTAVLSGKKYVCILKLVPLL